AEFLKIASSRFSLRAVLAAYSGTRITPQSASASRTSTASLFDDSEPPTSTSSGRDALRNGQLFAAGSTRQLWVRRSCGVFGRPDVLKYAGDAQITCGTAPRSCPTKPGVAGLPPLMMTSTPSPAAVESSGTTMSWTRTCGWLLENFTVSGASTDRA